MTKPTLLLITITATVYSLAGCSMDSHESHETRPARSGSPGMKPKPGSMHRTMNTGDMSDISEARSGSPGSKRGNADLH